MTPVFKPESGIYARSELSSVGRVCIPVAAAIVIASVVGGVYDARLLLAGMMVLFIVAPMGVLLLWLRLTSRTHMRLRLRPQRWDVTDSRLEIHFFGFDEKDEHPVESITIDLSEISGFDTIGSNYIVRTRLASAQALVVPREHLDAKSVKTLSNAVYSNLRAKDDEELA